MFRTDQLCFINKAKLEEERRIWNKCKIHPAANGPIQNSERVPWVDWHKSLVDNRRISNETLISIAIEKEGKANESMMWTEASVLISRMNHELVQRVYELLDHFDQDARVIGAMITRQANQTGQLSKKQKNRCFTALLKAFDEEPSTYARTWILRAIGWYKNRRSVDFLLEYVDSDFHAIRLVLADIIAFNRPDLTIVRPNVLQGILKLAGDSSPRVAWEILYEIAEYPEHFINEAPSIIEVAQRQTRHSDQELADVATDVLNAMNMTMLDIKRVRFLERLQSRLPIGSRKY